MDLLLPLDRAAGDALHAQLERALRERVRDGRLPRGTRLPSSRALGRELGVSRALLAAAAREVARAGSPAVGSTGSPILKGAGGPSRRATKEVK